MNTPITDSIPSTLESHQIEKVEVQILPEWVIWEVTNTDLWAIIESEWWGDTYMQTLPIWALASRTAIELQEVLCDMKDNKWNNEVVDGITKEQIKQVKRAIQLEEQLLALVKILAVSMNDNFRDLPIEFSKHLITDWAKNAKNRLELTKALLGNTLTFVFHAIPKKKLFKKDKSK